MYVVIKKNSDLGKIQLLKQRIEQMDCKVVEISDREQIKIGIFTKNIQEIVSKLRKEEIIEKIVQIDSPFRFSSKEFKESETIIEVKGRKIGAGNLVVIGGPCSIESREMIFDIAKTVKEVGGEFLRGGAFKPRTSPYDFQGLGEIGLKYMREACDRYELVMVTEVMDTKDIELVGKYTDIFQVGARNMQNFSLLKELGKVKKPVLLKRGLSATLKEFLMAAEYIVAHGNYEVILCERGIRTFESATRNTVDINGIAYLKSKTHFPIIIDASHGTGIRELVEPVTLGALLAGADGAMLEVHKNPECAYSDREQTLNYEQFRQCVEKIKKTMEFKERLKCI